MLVLVLVLVLVLPVPVPVPVPGESWSDLDPVLALISTGAILVGCLDQQEAERLVVSGA